MGAAVSDGLLRAREVEGRIMTRAAALKVRDGAVYEAPDTYRRVVGLHDGLVFYVARTSDRVRSCKLASFRAWVHRRCRASADSMEG